MKGIGYKIAPILLLGLFIAVMTTGSLLKKPLSNNDHVMSHVDDLKKHVQEKKWEKAKNELEKAQKAWKKVASRIQFSAERDEINRFKLSLERTNGFILAEDQGGALAELSEARFIWSELGK